MLLLNLKLCKGRNQRQGPALYPECLVVNGTGGTTQCWLSSRNYVLGMPSRL